LKAVGPAATNTALPAVDKPAAAPDQVNDVKSGSQPAAQVQTGTKKGKSKNVPVDKSKESSTKKKKTGLDKLNPF
jgi:outer membrane protein assembly factor BamD